MVRYIPKQGDVVFLDFNPVKGHEQKGKRPAIVLSNNTFNKYTKMIFACPITSNIKYFPTHFELQSTKKIKGSVLCEHFRSLDFNARNIKFIERVSDEEILSVISLVNACIME